MVMFDLFSLNRIILIWMMFFIVHYLKRLKNFFCLRIHYYELTSTMLYMPLCKFLK